MINRWMSLEVLSYWYKSITKVVIRVRLSGEQANLSINYQIYFILSLATMEGFTNHNKRKKNNKSSINFRKVPRNQNFIIIVIKFW